jgi:transcriptional regulator with XRE-family HTH domain
MPHRNNSADETNIVSRERVIEVMARVIRKEIYVRKRMSLQDLADESGVDKRVLDAWLADSPVNQREPKLSAALSVAFVLGKPAVNAIVGMIGYGAARLDAEEAFGPAMVAVEMMENVTRFARCAADNNIDHTEEDITTEAADNVINLALPYSSRRA